MRAAWLVVVACHSPPVRDEADGPLRIEWRRVQAMSCLGNERIRIDPDGRAAVTHNRTECADGVDFQDPWSPTVRLDASAMKQLAREVIDSGFFDLAPRFAAAATDGYRDELVVELAGRTHTVVVEHVEPPPAFARVRAAIAAAAD